MTRGGRRAAGGDGRDAIELAEVACRVALARGGGPVGKLELATAAALGEITGAAISSSTRRVCRVGWVRCRAAW